MVFPQLCGCSLLSVFLCSWKRYRGLSTATFLDDRRLAQTVDHSSVQGVVAWRMISVLPSPSPSHRRRNACFCWTRLKTPKLLLLQKLLSGETFGVEDFPGGDTSFCPKVDSAHGADQCGEENPVPNPVHRRNLRPRKPVDVKIQDISSEEDSEPAVFPCSNGCTDLGLPRESSVIAGRGSGGDNHVRLPPTSSGLKPRPNQSGKRRKTVASASVVKLIRIKLRAAAETGQLQLRDRGLKKKYPPKVALQQLWTVYPVRYRLSSLWRRRLPMAWEKTNPHRYRSVEVCVHAIPTGAKLTQSQGDRLGHNKSVTARCAPPDLSVEARLVYTESKLIVFVCGKRLFPIPAPEKWRRSGIVGGSSYGGFLVGVHGIQINRLRLRKRLFPIPAPEKWRSGSGSPTDVDYSQQEENRHERDLDPLGRGRKKT
ncbi:hypothetical protein Bca52824_017771 [Brassica carinata]|uniref:Uncharacterized protein n=1 Tax=Brassica carinata TaxID=52824 RepID=A0A8X8AVQ7_BRACI|nr:hypothetical protein Bca52824_017771 [Brassica carinata]